MDLFIDNGNNTCEEGGKEAIKPNNNKSLSVQLVLSLVLGLSAFLLFCFLRPRWPSLYAARKRRLDHQLGLPELSNSAFGWIPQVYKITEEQVLASAGLDAFVFLSFFKMATRLFAVMAFFATVVLLPINSWYDGFVPNFGNHNGDSDDSNKAADMFYLSGQVPLSDSDFDYLKDKDDKDHSWDMGWLWAYVVFTYFFAGLTIYYLNWETFRIIRYRQDYLGSQSTVTDRTFRLTGIPSDLRSEYQIKQLIEKLDIGTVDKVTICRDWKRLDDLVDLRDVTLRSLEGAWATFLKYQRDKNKTRGSQGQSANGATSNHSLNQEPDEEAGENGRLLNPDQQAWDASDEGRPKVNIRYGTLGLRSRNLDAIDYYEERLRRLDAKIIDARKKTYTPTDMAIVTMDSVASCQMFIQARIDPRPGRLLTKPTPAPSDLVWRNTYSRRGIRRLKSWAVTLFITVLTFVWIVPTAGLASFLSICTIRKVLPSFGDWLQSHTIIYSLFQNGLPALIVSLLNVAVPYLYDFLSNRQGMISQGDVELSTISKNYFFTFFNTFFIFTISATGFGWWSEMRKFVKDTSQIPLVISEQVVRLSVFYTSFIMLQGIGLMPFRILEAGSVFLYPILKMMSKTPRDAEEMKQPPVFQYGFFLPTALLIFNLCLIYSVLHYGSFILITGTIYFSLGYFTFKYMVLYAMDQPQHATGGAWRIICYRIIVGLVVFEVVMFGSIAAQKAFIASVCILPLIPFSIWYSYYIKQRFEPLTRYIALRAIRADEDSEDSAAMDDAFEEESGPRPSQTILRRGSTLDEYKEKGLTFVNPSLVVPLPQPWIYKDPPPPLTQGETDTTEEQDRPILQGVDSTLGIGDENVWQDTAGRPINVVPAGTANVQRLTGSDYGVLQLDNRPLSMRLPHEIIQHIYHFLSPEDFRNARCTSRSWFLAGLDRNVLVKMLKRGGWWNSLQQILKPLSITRLLDISQERLVSKWISRECDLASLTKSAFTQVGFTDFSGLVPGSATGRLHGTLVFTMSLCGRFVMVTHGRTLYVYELNHVCLNRRSSWSVPPRLREYRRPGLLRPVATVDFPRRVISCSMDTSSGRYAVGVLMEGRMGMVCDIMGGWVGAWSRKSSKCSNEDAGPSTSRIVSRTPPVCYCQETPVTQAPSLEEDARTDHDLSRWFPLTSPSDFLFFLPARNGVDTGKKLRLISSAAALGNLLGPVGNGFQGFETNVLEAANNAGVTAMGPGGGDVIVHDIHSVADLPGQRLLTGARGALDQLQQDERGLRRISASSADHHRAVPLSDGYHILFTDPTTGDLCLGTDAPAGSLNRLIRKVWFRPPTIASTRLPLLYTAGSDIGHGVRVVATFSVDSGDIMQLDSNEVATSHSSDPPKAVDADKQMIVFYTIPPDMFLDISRGRACHWPIRTTEDMETGGLSEWADWRPQGSYGDIDFLGDPFAEGTAYPLEIRGQPVAICSNLVELALDSGPDMVLWAFSAQGWARTWAMHAGREDAFNHIAVQHDGSLRHIDHDGDCVMAGTEVEQAAAASRVDARGN
ncbi:cefP [Fusarium albosuccineum]|uniref:CefP n=1 Tax=Fusarium albosuccineum TaxID=1237068 RepID=A0A8H4P7X4_9HYPO|nr:cefP [Fusarium albosuccineum]